MSQEPEWVNVHVGWEGDCVMDGLPVSEHKWHNTGQRVNLENRPDDSHTSDFIIYEIRTEDRTIEFAAREVVNGAFSFYRFMVRPDKFRDLKKSLDIKEYLIQKDRSKNI